MQTPLSNSIEYFNETAILIAVYHYFSFTDFVIDPTTRYTAGYSLIFCTLFIVFVNIFLLLNASVTKVILKLKTFRYWFRKKKYTKK